MKKQQILLAANRFNRTFMELKSMSIVKLRNTTISFNRTFMELKFRPSMEAPERAQSFNRTFMELKYLQPVTTGYAVAVLIVPLWN